MIDRSINKSQDSFQRSIRYLTSIFTCNVKQITNEVLKLRKKQLQSRIADVNNQAQKVKEMIELKTSCDIYDTIKQNHDTLYELCLKDERDINDEVKLRELDKLDNFKKV